MTRPIREDTPQIKRILSEVREAQDEGQREARLAIGDIPVEVAVHARTLLERQGHRVRLTRDHLEVTFAPPRLHG